MQIAVGGELLKVCNASGDPANPTLATEGQPGCETTNFVNAGTTTTSLDYHAGPGGLVEWFGAERLLQAHLETTSAGGWVHPAVGEVAISTIDPVYTDSGGVVWFDTQSGAEVQSLSLFRSLEGGYAGKSNSIGDIEGCFVASEIGDYVWFDADADGVQDPAEPRASHSPGRVNARS